MTKKDDIVVGLDIGTTKVCAIVGEVKENGLEIIGVGTHPSKGLRKGVVINIESTVQSIKKAVQEAELMAGCEIKTVFAGIAGGHIKAFNSHGVIAVKDREICKSDIDRVIEAAQAIAIPTDREVIHVLPQDYIIDGQNGIQEPLGLSGVRLEAKVHIVTASVTSAQNIVRSANKAGLDVADVVLQPIASSDAVLSQDERELGVILVDIGGGTTDIAIYHNGTVKHTGVISLGGNQVTGDIAIGLRTPANEAEKIKMKYSCALTSMIPRDETLEVPSVGGRKPRVISRQMLGEIIEARVDELFQFTNREVEKSGYGGITASGVVLTGGTASMEGIVELAEQVFNLPVRRGIPVGVSGLVDVVKSPMYSTGVGLVLYGMKSTNMTPFRAGGIGTFDKLFSTMKGWMKDFF